MKVELDEFDIEILKIVQQNNRLATEVIAESVCLSPSAVQRRLKRLRKTGVIEADRAIISPEAVGQELTAIVEITLKEEQLDILDEFKELMINAPQVMQCYYITGAADFIVIIVADSMQSYEAFARKFFLENPIVKRYQTNVVLQRIKSSFIVPLKLK